MGTTPEAVSAIWATPGVPEFWSVVPHADQLYGRTEAGIVRWREGERRWYSVKANPQELYCFGLAAGPGSLEPIYAIENSFLFVSYDGCRSWERRSLPFRAIPSVHSSMAADPRQSSTLYVFGQSGTPEQSQHVLFSTFDAGRTWDGPLSIGPAGPAFNMAPHNLLVLANNPSHSSGGVFMATAHAIYKATLPVTLSAASTPVLEFPVSAQRAIGAMAVGSGGANPRPLATNPVAVAISQGTDHHIQVLADGAKEWTTRDPYPGKFSVDDLLFAGDVLFAKTSYKSPPQSGKVKGAILMSRDLGGTWFDITPADLADQLGLATPSPLPREGLAASSTHLYFMSRGIGVRSIELSALAKIG